MTHQEIYPKHTYFQPSLRTVTGWGEKPKRTPGELFAGRFVFPSIEQRKTTMNIADVSLAISMGLAAGVVISGILIIAWFLAVTPRRTKR